MTFFLLSSQHTSKVEESLVVISYLVMDELNGSEFALIPLRNLRKKKKKKTSFIFLTLFKLIITSIFIHE